MVSPTAAMVTLVGEACAPARWTRPDAPAGPTPELPRTIAGTMNVTIRTIRTLRTVAQSIRARCPGIEGSRGGICFRAGRTAPWRYGMASVRRGTGAGVRNARILGIVLIVGGMIALGFGWAGSARRSCVDCQIPYLISGGAVGLGLIVIGSVLFVVAQMRVA